MSSEKLTVSIGLADGVSPNQLIAMLRGLAEVSSANLVSRGDAIASTLDLNLTPGEFLIIYEKAPKRTKEILGSAIAADNNRNLRYVGANPLGFVPGNLPPTGQVGKGRGRGGVQAVSTPQGQMTLAERPAKGARKKTKKVASSAPRTVPTEQAPGEPQQGNSSVALGAIPKVKQLPPQGTKTPLEKDLRSRIKALTVAFNNARDTALENAGIQPSSAEDFAIDKYPLKSEDRRLLLQLAGEKANLIAESKIEKTRRANSNTSTGKTDGRDSPPLA